MLHKSKSNKFNLLKFAFIIPLLAFFLMSFNTEEIYITPEVMDPISDVTEIEVIVITKESTKADLDKVKKEFEAHGVTLKFKNVKRNAANEIIAIKIDAKTSKSNASFNMSSDEGIKPIKIVYDKDTQSISIGNGEVHFDKDHDYHFMTKDGHTVVKSGTGSNVFITKEEIDEHDGTKKHKMRKTYEVRRQIGTTDDDQDHDVEIIIKDEDLDKVLDTIIKQAQTGKIGDGKIIVEEVSQFIRIRTGESSEDAL